MIRLRTSTVLVALGVMGHLWVQNRKMKEAMLRHDLVLPTPPLAQFMNAFSASLEKARQRRMERQVLAAYAAGVDRPLAET